jgi:hypothetical protein
VNLPGFKQAAQAALGFDAARHEQQARGVLVKAVDHLKRRNTFRYLY